MKQGLLPFAIAIANLKMRTHRKTTIGSIVTMLVALSALGQGALSPTGSPAPNMRTLTQMEPRTPISSAPYTIIAPGSYYLATNIYVGSTAITIYATGVTLDLNGFTIFGTNASASSGGNGITVASGANDVKIYNGHIIGGVTNNGSGTYSGPGFSSGITVANGNAMSALIRDVSVRGCQSHGFNTVASANHLVENCIALSCGGYGISARKVRGCVARDCGDGGISAESAIDSTGEAEVGYGVYATVIQNCYGYSKGASGVYGYTVANSYGRTSSTDAGLYGNAVQNCYGYTSGNWVGLQAYTAANSYGHASGTGGGIRGEFMQGCYGFAAGTGTGIYANGSVIGGQAYSSGGTALSCYIANSVKTGGGTNSISFKYNMP